MFLSVNQRQICVNKKRVLELYIVFTIENYRIIQKKLLLIILVFGTKFCRAGKFFML